MIRMHCKPWLATAVVGIGAGFLVYACVPRHKGVGDDSIEIAQSALKVPGSLVRQSYLIGDVATQVAVDRIDEVEYYSDPCGDDCSDYVGHCKKDAFVQQFATAIVTDTSTLTVGLANLADDGSMTKIGTTWQDPTTIKKVAVAALDRQLFVVGTKNSDNTLTLRVFQVFDVTSGTGMQLLTQYVGANDSNVIKLGDFSITRVPVHNTAVADTSTSKESYPTDTDIIKLAVAYSTPSNASPANALRVTAFDIKKATGAIQRQTTTTAVQTATKVSVAAPQRPDGVFATASVGTDALVSVVYWTVDDSGQVAALASRNVVGTSYTDVTSAPAGYRRVAVYAKGGTSAKLALFELLGAGATASVSQKDSMTDDSTRLLTDAALASGGSSRFYLVGKSGADVIVRSYLAMTGLQDLDELAYTGYGTNTVAMAATVFESSRLLTAGVNGSSQLRVNSWHDYHVPLARGFWPTTATRTLHSPAPPAPGDTQPPFAFDPKTGQVDLSIAASDKYVVACGYDFCQFFDKAGKALKTKYDGPLLEYVEGTAVPLSSLTGGTNGLFDSAVGIPGVASAPVAEESLLRHLEYQHTCDPELPRGNRNRCPNQAYDTSVTYDPILQRFVIVTNFRFLSGCGDWNARYPAIAVSATTDPRDGFFVYVSTEGGGRDMPRISAQNGVAIVSWNGGGDLRTLGPNAELFELADLIGTPRTIPRATKIDRVQVPPTSGAVPLVTRGAATVGMIIEQDKNGDDDNKGRIWTLPRTAVGPIAVKHQNLRYPFVVTAGDDGATPPVVAFKNVGTDLYDGHLYKGGISGGGYRMRVMDYNYRYSSATNDLWLAGTAWQQLDCKHPTSGAKIACLVYGLAVDDQGRMFLNYTGVGHTDIGSDGFVSANYALFLRPTAPPLTGVLEAGVQWRDQTTIRTDFALPSADPTNASFWTVTNRSTGSSYSASAGRVSAPAIPTYSGIGRLWTTNTTTQPATLAPSYTWQDKTWRSTWRQIVRGDFDGDGLDDLFFYDDKAGEGRFYKMTTTGMQAIGGATTGLGSALYVVALEVCGATGSLCPGSVSNNTRELLFYDWVRGETSFWRLGGSGTLVKIASTFTRHTWSIIVAGDFHTDPGDELIFYDPTIGELKYNSVTPDGQYASPKSNMLSDIGGDATAIVSGDFTADVLDEIYVYTPYQAKGRVYQLDSNGQTGLASTVSTRGTWARVATMGNSSNVLVQYDPALPPTNWTGQDGTLSFTKVTVGQFVTENQVPLLDTGNGRNWSDLIIGDFLSTPGKEIVFYRQVAPVDPPCTPVGNACRRVVVNTPGGCSNGASYMYAGQGRYTDEFMLSCDGRTRLYMQFDGNLVLAKKDGSQNFSNILWTSGTANLVVDYAIMEANGDFVLYNPDGARVAHTNTDGKPGLHLKIFDDGSMKLYGSAYGTVWDTAAGDVMK